MHKLEKGNIERNERRLFLILNDQASLDEINEELDRLFEQIKKDNKHEQNFNLVIDTKHRILDEATKEALTEKISEHTNFVMKCFSEDVIDKQLADRWHEETSPKMVVRNIRNGQIVHRLIEIFILFGDIRPGAVVRSAGSVVVIGDVKGTIHAGSKGDEDAIIVAPFLYDAQVRIGEHVEIIEKNADEESEEINFEHLTRHQVVYLNDLHMIEFGEVEDLTRIRPDFAKDLGGFEEWQKQL